MTMGRQRKMIELEEGLTIIQKGITKLKNLLEGIPEQQFNSEEYLKLYTLVYKMSTQSFPHNYWLQLYDRCKDSLKDYLNTTVLPAIVENHGEYMLRELLKRWDQYQLFVRWLGRFFIHLDQTILKLKGLPALNEISLPNFRDLVYEEIKNKATDAVITLIDREREGGQIDRALLKNTLGIFVAVGMGCMDAYERDFEVAMLTDTAAYYSRKAASWIEEYSLPVYMLKVEECLEKEKERVGHYLLASSQPKLLENVKSGLLMQYENQLLEKAHSDCHILFRDDKVEDLSRMYRLFCIIPEGLAPFAAMLRHHVADEGESLVEQAKAAARMAKDEMEERQDGQEQAFVRKIIELHDKYSQLVRKCFEDHWLFSTALKEAFKVFCNKVVARGTSIAEFLATFCDNLLKKGGSERLGDEAIERTLDQIVKILGYISDKDLFAEFYQKKLCGRLLLDKSANDDHERSMVTMLKQQYGGLITAKMEGMLTDLTLARENQAAFTEYQRDNSASNPGIDLSVTVLNNWFWPINKSSDLAMPAEMVKCVEVYNDFYATKTQSRKLTWIYSLGTCTLIGRFDPKPIELVVTTYQAAVLQLFNETDRLSVAEIKGHLNLSDETIERVLHSLSCAKHKLLNKDPNTKTVTLTDSFEYNRKFTDKMKRIIIPHPQSMDAKKKVIEDVVKDRRYAVDASIVRIMKCRRALTYQKLVGECVEQLGQMFKPDVKFIRRRIEDLISREYLERDRDDPKTFTYLA